MKVLIRINLGANISPIPFIDIKISYFNKVYAILFICVKIISVDALISRYICTSEYLLYENKFIIEQFGEKKLTLKGDL